MPAIRNPDAEGGVVRDSTQVELHADRNQQLAQSVLRGVVTLDYRTTDRVAVVDLPGCGPCEFKLRLAADPGRAEQFGLWHLANRVTLPGASEPVAAGAHDAFAIRDRVL